MSQHFFTKGCFSFTQRCAIATLIKAQENLFSLTLKPLLRLCRKFNLTQTLYKRGGEDVFKGNQKSVTEKGGRTQTQSIQRKEQRIQIKC